ncbi:protein of unknown function [Hyphomicrobium sp. 1Nfss2.1]
MHRCADISDRGAERDRDSPFDGAVRARTLTGLGLWDGAGDRDRTDDIQLGKLTFYH